MKREYIYNRSVPVKSVIDGVESMRTMKLRTPHEDTHMICAPLATPNAVAQR